jgi:hypothetical protein
MDETVTISKVEYQRLLADSEWLQCLKDAGVDNWSGYDFACDLAREKENGTAQTNDSN